MDDKRPLIRRPIRLAVALGLATATLGALAARSSGKLTSLALAFAVGYGAFLGWYAVGLALAARFRATPWFALSLAVPAGLLAGVAVGWRLAPEAMFRWWSVLGLILLAVLAAWVMAGGILAACGWWRHARGDRRET